MSADGVMCLRHGKACKLPDKKVTLFAAGFSCKNNSVLNPSRFEENPLREGCETAVTYDGAFASIMHLKPRYFILENVSGARRSSSKHVFIILRV